MSVEKITSIWCMSMFQMDLSATIFMIHFEKVYQLGSRFSGKCKIGQKEFYYQDC